MEKKFRVWLNKKMIYIKDDIYISFFNAKGAVDWSICNRKDQTTIYKHDISYPEIYNNSKLMQYTGLKDMNGKEIFEGDIFKYGSIIVNTVLFKEGMFCYAATLIMDDYVKLSNYYFDWENDKASKIEVIGNVYQNKELLK